MSFAVDARRGRLHAARAPLRRRAARSSPRDAVLERLQPWLEDAARPRSARTRSTTATSSPTTASRCAAWRTTRCSSPTCSKATSATTWTRSPRATSGARTCCVRRRRGQGRARRSPSTRSTSQRATEYSAEDADVTLQLHGALWPRIEARREADAHLRDDRDAGGRACCSRMERNGVLIDAQLLARAEPGARPEDARARARRPTSSRAGPSTSVRPSRSARSSSSGSSCKVVKKTPSGAPSTDEEVLEKLAAGPSVCADAPRAPRRWPS